MALLNDIGNIIKTININSDVFNNMDNILENLIIHENTIYNSFIFNHIIYQSTTNHNNIIDYIKKHINSNIKNQRIHFRNLNKKNKLNITDFNIYFDKMYKLINKLNSMFQHIIPNKNSKHGTNGPYKWGNNILWFHTIQSINNILFDDIVFKCAINTNIKNNNPEYKNPDMSKLNNYMNIFIDYIDNKEQIYNNFVEHIDAAIVDNIDSKINLLINSINVLDIQNNNIIYINVFNNLYKYFTDYYVNYYYITKQKSFDKFKQYITNYISKIFENNNITFIKHFLTIYKKEFISLIKHINLNNILLTYPCTNINDFIHYYKALHELSEGTILNSVVSECIEDNVNKYFNTFENILYLADLINTDIINKKLTRFYYLLGYYINNKDEFIMAISQKLMERIIYTNIDINYEIDHKNCIEKIFMFSKNYLLKYSIIINDYINSKEYSTNNCNIIITSLDAWKINHSTGYSNTIINNEEFTTSLCNLSFKYNQHNNYHNIKKKLIMYPHLGCVEININSKNNSKNTIYVLPAHMFCLELFTSPETTLSYDFVFNKVKENMSNYSDDFIKKIINSLINHILIKTPDELLKINNKIDTDININDINMIEIFHNMNNTNKIIIKQMKEELCHDKIDIISSNINHHIKKFEQINIDILYEIIFNNIKLFEVNKDIYMKTINKMIKNDYIELNDNKVKKILF